MATGNSSSGNAASIAHTMRAEAAFENKPNHVRHVENQIAYANAVAENALRTMQEWVNKEVPIMVRKEVDKYLESSKTKVKVDENSLAEAAKKVRNMIKSIFK